MKSMDFCTGVSKGRQQSLLNASSSSGNKKELHFSPIPVADDHLARFVLEGPDEDCIFKGEAAQLDQMYLRLRQQMLEFKKERISARDINTIRQNLSSLSQNIAGTLNLLNILRK